MNILFSTIPSEQRRESLLKDHPQHSIDFVNNLHEHSNLLAKAEVIVTYGEDLTDELIKQAIALKWVMVISAGIDQLPHEALMKRDILVTNARGIHPVPMSEYAISMLLHVKRQEDQLLENAKHEIWDRSVRINEISESTIVVLGAGAIGQEVARLAKAFRMKTYGVARSNKKVEHFDKVVAFEHISDVLKEADYVVAVLPSTPDTKGLFTLNHFKQMKKEAVFLNMGRGDLVKSEDIIKALENEYISHAVLDVFEKEPLPKGHPLWTTKNVTITPHLSGKSPQYLPRAFEIFAYNLAQLESGENNFKNVIDHSKGY
ncbi:MAG TPA: D-2-hydroxyacid dehydrogenase [Bacillota bacterium]|nr:D-2-hydroxyacid dehydrogenase [Bacillota bacterium]